MPAPIAPFVGFLLGIVFAWAAAAPGRTSEAEASGRPLAVAALFGLLVFAPCAAYFLAFAPDWAYAYALENHRLSAAADLGVLLLCVASVPAGLTVAARPARERKLAAVLRIAALPLLATLTFVVVALPRLSVHATYAQFHGDFGRRDVAGSSLGYALLWMNLVLGAGTALTARALRRMALGERRR